MISFWCCFVYYLLKFGDSGEEFYILNFISVREGVDEVGGRLVMFFFMMRVVRGKENRFFFMF